MTMPRTAFGRSHLPRASQVRLFGRDRALLVPMNLVRAGAAAAALLVATAAAARANELPSHVDVRADRVAFYPYQNVTLVAATGNVVVRAGGRVITGGALRYDVIKNRILVTGDVEVKNHLRTMAVQAYALDLATGDAEVLRIEDVPRTFAVHDDDLDTAKEGPPPKDTFAQVDLDGARPYIRSHHAIVTPGAGVRMSPADFPTGAGPAVRLPTFFYTLVQNQNIQQTSLPGSTFDQPFNLIGTPGSLLAAHVRYDSYYGATLAFDERLVNRDKSYAVVSILPLRDRQIDAIAFEQIRPGLQQTLNLTHTIGAYPFNAASYRIQDTGKLTTETLQASTSNYDNTAGFDVATIAHDVGHYFTYQVHSGYGYDHTLFGYPYDNDFRTTVGGLLEAPSFATHGFSFDEKYNYTYTSYDYPHQLTDGTLTFTTARTYRKIAFLGTIGFEQTDDRYRDPAVTARVLGLPDPTTPYYAPDGTYYPGFYAFAGLTTLRTYQLVTTVNGTGDNRVQFTVTHTHDFPQYHGYGRPPLTTTLDITRRITPLLRVEVARSYTFGWDGRYLSPEYSLSISP